MRFAEFQLVESAVKVFPGVFHFAPAGALRGVAVGTHE
jgi:hypothetical protein